MDTEVTAPKPPAEQLVETLAKRGVELHADGARVWPTPKASLTADEAATAEKLNTELIALLTPPPTYSEQRAAAIAAQPEDGGTAPFIDPEQPDRTSPKAKPQRAK